MLLCLEQLRTAEELASVDWNKHLDQKRIELRRKTAERLAELIESGDEEGYVALVKSAKSQRHAGVAGEPYRAVSGAAAAERFREAFMISSPARSNSCN
jgi:LAS superfamily LD-carboxypeptidase LdcB